MKTITFDATVHEGRIELPPQYQAEFPAAVTVTVTRKPRPPEKVVNANGLERFFGSLSAWANPALWDEEKTAWERAAAEKYATR